MHYDLIIVGAGPAGIFTAMEYLARKQGGRILIIEKGRSIGSRVCPKRNSGICEKCVPCNITSGFSGAGAFSDGKLILSPEIGGSLSDYIGRDELNRLIAYVDGIYLSYGADEKIYGARESETIEKLRHQAIVNNLKFLESPIRHIGTEKCYELYTKIQERLLECGVEILFNTMAEELIIDDGRVRGVVAGGIYLADRVVMAVGREGAEWLKGLCGRYGIATKTGGVDIGVRVEVRNEIMEEINREIYESKLIYYTPTFEDRVRTFCHNPSGVVSAENYHENLTIVNGHSYKSEEFRTQNTNFAILVTSYFTEPFREPIEYGKHIARMGNLLSGNRVIVQRFGDLMQGRRTTDERLGRNNIRPTLTDAVPGDLSLVLPYRIMLDIRR